MYEINNKKRRLRIFTWHVHGSYLYYLSQGDYDLYIPVDDQKSEGYYGRGETFPFGDNVIEVAAREVRNLDFDCILFQSERNFLIDQHYILNSGQKKLPRIYLEHNTPEGHPVNTRHIASDPSITLVHVTHFNKLMWNNGIRNVHVIEHGVTIGDAHYTGEIEKGIVVINHPKERGRITGWDIFTEIAKHVPLELVGMGTREHGGLGEVLNPHLAAFISHYRFFFNPIRYTSLGLAVCEAMMVGMPIVALATTEYATVIRDGHSGFIDTNIDRLVDDMKTLIAGPDLARSMGANAKGTALERFDIRRFTEEWQRLFYQTIQLNIRDYEKEDSVY